MFEHVVTCLDINCNYIASNHVIRSYEKVVKETFEEISIEINDFLGDFLRGFLRDFLRGFLRDFYENS